MSVNEPLQEEDEESQLSWSVTHWVMLTCALITLAGTLAAGYLLRPDSGPNAPAGATPATEAGKLLLRSDFNSPADTPFRVGSGNPQAKTSFDLDGGEFRIRVQAAPRNQVVLSLGPDFNRNGVLIVEFDVRADGQIQDLVYGLNLRSKDAALPGDVSLGVSVRGSHEIAIDGRPTNSQLYDGVKTGGATNHLRVEVTAREAHLYVNEQHAGRAAHPALGASPLIVGFFLVNSSAQDYAVNAVTNVYFDNLRILERPQPQ